MLRRLLNLLILLIQYISRRRLAKLAALAATSRSHAREFRLMSRLWRSRCGLALGAAGILSKVATANITTGDCLSHYVSVVVFISKNAAGRVSMAGPINLTDKEVEEVRDQQE